MAPPPVFCFDFDLNSYWPHGAQNHLGKTDSPSQQMYMGCYSQSIWKGDPYLKHRSNRTDASLTDNFQWKLFRGKFFSIWANSEVVIFEYTDLFRKELYWGFCFVFVGGGKIPIFSYQLWRQKREVCPLGICTVLSPREPIFLLRESPLTVLISSRCVLSGRTFSGLNTHAWWPEKIIILKVTLLGSPFIRFSILLYTC